MLGDGILDCAALLTQLKGTLSNGVDFPPYEIDCEWPGAGRRTMSLQARQFALPGRSPNMVLLSVHDITSHKKTEATNTRLAAIVESSDDAIPTNDINGIITSSNGAAQRLFGYAADEIIGNPITLLIPADRRDEEAGILERVSRAPYPNQPRVRSLHYFACRRRAEGVCCLSEPYPTRRRPQAAARLLRPASPLPLSARLR